MPIGHIGIVLLLSALPLHFMEATEASAFSYGRADVGLVQTIRLQQVADDLRRRLEILERVDVAVVPHNPLVMSVETLAGRSGPDHAPFFEMLVHVDGFAAAQGAGSSKRAAEQAAAEAFLAREQIDVSKSASL